MTAVQPMANRMGLTSTTIRLSNLLLLNNNRTLTCCNFSFVNKYCCRYVVKPFFKT